MCIRDRVDIGGDGPAVVHLAQNGQGHAAVVQRPVVVHACLLYTSDVYKRQQLGGVRGKALAQQNVDVHGAGAVVLQPHPAQALLNLQAVLQQALGL